jgi:hypothetical protein
MEAYGSCPTAHVRAPAANSRKIAIVLAAFAILSVLAAVATVAASSPMHSVLMDKQQAEWWGMPHKDVNGNWDRGWLAHFANSRNHGARGRNDEDTQQLAYAPSAPSGNKAELDEIHSLLNTAVGMLGSIEGSRHMQQQQQQLAGAPATLPQENRIAKVKADIARGTPGIGEQPQCFKLNGFTDMDRAKVLHSNILLFLHAFYNPPPMQSVSSLCIDISQISPHIHNTCFLVFARPFNRLFSACQMRRTISRCPTQTGRRARAFLVNA